MIAISVKKCKVFAIGPSGKLMNFNEWSVQHIDDKMNNLAISQKLYCRERKYVQKKHDNSKLLIKLLYKLKLKLSHKEYYRGKQRLFPITTLTC